MAFAEGTGAAVVPALCPVVEGRGITFGVVPWRTDHSGAARSLAEQARRAEELGLLSFWLPESHFVRAARPAPLLELASVAASTRTIRLGTTSLLLPVRHPVSTAEEIAVLDRLCEGRLIVGLGRGFRRDLFDVHGVEPRRKRTLLAEHLEKMVEAWTGSCLVGGEGEGPAVQLQPMPVQQPHPPLWLAAFGPKALGQAGSLGLPYLCAPIESFERLRSNFDIFRDALGGRTAPAAVPAMRTVVVVDGSGQRERVEQALRHELRGWVRAGRVAADRVDAQRWLVGSLDEVEEQIRARSSDLGITHWIARVAVQGIDLAETERSLERLGDLAQRVS